MILGVDPSQRHVGLCLRNQAGALFHEIKTEDQDVLTSARTVRRELRAFIRENKAEATDWCIEKQLSVGGQSSSLMFYFMLQILEVVKEMNDKPRLVMPMPIQLTSYVRKRHNCPAPAQGSQLVKFYQEQTCHQGRISVHKVDAYYLACLGEDVLSGVWSYKLPSREPAVHPWKVYNGR